MVAPLGRRRASTLRLYSIQVYSMRQAKRIDGRSLANGPYPAEGRRVAMVKNAQVHRFGPAETAGPLLCFLLAHLLFMVSPVHAAMVGSDWSTTRSHGPSGEYPRGQ